MQPFYWVVDKFFICMFQNNITCDLYIGSGAGKKLHQDILSAKKSVKIISPYISGSQVDLLLGKMNEKIDVRIITSSDIIGFKNALSIFRRIIVQTSFTNSVKSKAKKKYLNCSFFAAVVICILLFSGFCFQMPQTVLYAVITVLFLVMLYSFYKYKVMRVLYFKYSWRFPIKVLLSGNNKFVHSKIYLIDDQIAYVGSMNFTEKGMKYNHESRIRFVNEETVQKLTKEFDDLFTNPDYMAMDPYSILKVLNVDPHKGLFVNS